MMFARLPYENGMPNAVAGNLQCLAVPWRVRGRKEVNREALVQKNRTLLANRTENCPNNIRRLKRLQSGIGKIPQK